MSLDEDLRNLSRIPLFATLEADARRLIAFAGETRILRGGDILFRRGEVSDGGYVVQSGVILLDPGEVDGMREPHAVRPYSLIGEMALISQTHRAATAYASEPATVLKISRPLFHRVLKEYPSSAAQLRDFVEKRLADFTRELNGARLRWLDEDDLH